MFLVDVLGLWDLNCRSWDVHDLLGSLLLHSFLHAGLAAGLLRNRRVCTHCGFSSSKSSPNQPSFGIKSIKPFRGRRVHMECAQKYVDNVEERNCCMGCASPTLRGTVAGGARADLLGTTKNRLAPERLPPRQHRQVMSFTRVVRQEPARTRHCHRRHRLIQESAPHHCRFWCWIVDLRSTPSDPDLAIHPCGFHLLPTSTLPLQTALTTRQQGRGPPAPQAPPRCAA